MDPTHKPATEPDAAFAPALASLFDADLEPDALERMLLALAVHPGAVGAQRAWLLLWNAGRGLLEGWREAAPTAAGQPLELALGDARRSAPREPGRGVLAWAAPPEALETALAEAWQGSGSAVGAPAEAAGSPWSDAGSLGAAHLRRGTQPYGLLVTSWPGSGDPAGRRARLETLRRLVDGALTVQARSAELRRRARHAEVVGEFARTSVASINLAEAMHLLARLATLASGVRGAAVYRVRDGRELRIEVAYGPAALRDRFADGWLATAATVVASRRARFGQRPEEADGLPGGMLGETSAWAALPIEAYGRVLGALVVWDGPDRHPGSPAIERADAECLSTLALQAGLLLEQAEAVDEVRRGERRREDQEVRLRDLDRLAAVGELAARVAREARNPIASISAFARRAHRELPADDAQREYLEIVIRESERLEAMLQEQLQYAQLPRTRLRMQNLNGVVQEALQHASETLVRRRVRLLKRLAPDLPELLLDEHRIRRVIENVVAFALETVPMGARLKVETRRAGEHVAVEIAHDGSRAGGDLLEQLFVPFSTGTHPGAAVGLGVAQQIVREHGGEIRVRGEGEWGTVFSFTLPVAGNEDRRQAPERRSHRSDRRNRGGERGPGEAAV